MLNYWFYYIGIIIIISLYSYFKIPIKLYLKGWRKIEMPSWVENKYYNLRFKKTLPYGKTYFFKGNNFIYRVYTTFPKVQGDGGKQFCYKKIRN